MQELDDIALLRQYTEQNSQEAFAVLVSRHINKVYSVALRHTRLTFADGHTEYWKWKSRRPSTTAFQTGTMEDTQGYLDLDRLLETAPHSD